MPVRNRRTKNSGKKEKKKEEKEVVVSEGSGEEFGEDFGEDFGEEEFAAEEEFEDEFDEEDEIDEETQEILDSKKYRKEDIDLVVKRICTILSKSDVSHTTSTHGELLALLEAPEMALKRELVKDKLQSTTHLLFRLEILEQVPPAEEEEEEIEGMEEPKEEEEEEEEEETKDDNNKGNGWFALHEKKLKTKQFEMLLGAIPTDDADALRASTEKLAKLKEEDALPNTDEGLHDAIRPCCSIKVIIPPQEIMSKMLIEEMVEYVDDEKFLDETPSDEELNAMQIRFNTRNIEAFVMGKRKDVDFKSVIFTLMMLSVLLPVLLSLFV